MIDIGNAHVIDWYLWREHQKIIDGWDACGRAFADMLEANSRVLRFDPEDWSRYDGEIL